MVVAKLILILTSIAAAGDGATLLCFGAKWCQPCKEMQPDLDRLHHEGFPVRKVDVDQNSELAARYKIEAVPSCVLVNNEGRVVDQINQATDYATLRRMLAHYGVNAASATIRGQAPTIRGQTPMAGIRVATNPRVPSSSNTTMIAPPEQNLSEQNPSDPSYVAPPEFAGDVRGGCVACSVRLRVEDEEGHSFGTGTVVDIHGEEALVLTCGHIFRSSEGKGRILIDRFDSKAAEPTTGSLISYDMDLDIALVSMKLTRPMQVAKLAPLQYKAMKGEPVFSVGCDAGDPPSVMEGQVNEIDKYLGPPNITASGRPVSGRSGGGLFNAKGQMIGVCSAADPEIDEGLYGALPRVYYELDRNGLSFVYQQQAASKTQDAIAATPNTYLQASINPPVALQPKQLSAVSSGSMDASTSTSPTPVAANAGITKKRELVCVLRTDEGDESRAFVIENPSTVLLEYLEREANKAQN